jgi:hypothetical protein
LFSLVVDLRIDVESFKVMFLKLAVAKPVKMLNKSIEYDPKKR